MSFYDWCIKQYTGKNNPAGDLAGDMSRDLEFPKVSDDKKTIERYLHLKHACDDAVRTFRNVFRMYQIEVRHVRATD